MKIYAHWVKNLIQMKKNPHFANWSAIELIIFRKKRKHLTTNLCILNYIEIRFVFHWQSGFKRRDGLFETNIDVRQLSKQHKTFSKAKNIPSDILNELQEIHSKKPVSKPKYSVKLLRYAFLLR